ncbi:MAG: NAD-dependent deacylase [Chloroflexi bacterium]|nr:NAD-dependent deacylase [Chloroflexota bacterium]
MIRRARTDVSQLKQAIELLRQAERLVVLTGAGVSTPSGIPDFRSEDTGLWSNVDPFEIASVWGFHENPARFYDWIRPLAITLQEAKPNAAHRALAELQRRGRLHTLITQNIDGLHQASGSGDVVELHGHLRTVNCPDCGFGHDADPYLQAFIADGAIPYCPDCGFVLKPDVILMGEPLSEHVIVHAQEEALRCDVMMVAGSSLEVMPAADLPALAARRGAKLILVNLGSTEYDRTADVTVRGDVADVLPKLVGGLR